MAASPSQHQPQHDGTLRYKVGIVMLLYLQAMSMIWTSSRLSGSASDCYKQEEVAFLLPQTPDCSHYNSSISSSVILQTNADDSNNDNPCSILLRKFHQINAQFRRQAGGSNNSSYYQPQPYFNYAYYTNQGFGRLVDHSTLHCVLALHLGRPCVLDLSTRDPFFTWRSFIHTGTYDWEMQKEVSGNNNQYWLEEYYREEIDRAVAEMKDIGDGKWERGIQNITPYAKLFLLNDAPETWPAKGKLPLPDFYKNIESWRPPSVNHIQQQQQSDDKAILSPNWGMWFPRLEMPFKAQGCKLPELLTRMQNALWQPTPLTLHLHRLRVNRYLSDDKKKKNNGDRGNSLQKATSWEPYGAIHIRTFFLKQGIDSEQRIRQLQPTLEKCIDMIVTRPRFNMSHIKKWWILADKHPIAVNLSQNITRFDIRHGYDDATFVANNEHSRMPSAQDVLAHKLMAPSVLDWTVLHQSHVALITSGSFGISGARGRGKQHRQTCGGYLELYY